MKVLIVSTGYPRNAKDVSGIFIKRLASALVSAGTEVVVLAPGDRKTRSKEVQEGIEIFRLIYAPRFFMRMAYGDGGIPENLKRWPWLFALLPLFFLSLVVHVLVLSGRCDVIHANWLMTGLLSLPARAIRKRPLVVTIRGTDLLTAPKRILSLVISMADAVTTVNETWSQELGRIFKRSLFYTPNGVEASQEVVDPRRMFNISKNELIVLYMGALREIKGVDILAEAARITAESNCSLRFLVVGPGDPQTFGLSGLPNVVCTGLMSPPDALAIYPECDIFVLPSRSEGRPNALLEAMASGLPSVATNLPGVEEILTSDSGILVHPEDPKGLAKAICKLADNHGLRKAMGKKAKERIEALSLTWEASAANYFKIYERVRLCAG